MIFIGMIKLVDLLLEDYPKGQYIPLDDTEKEQAQKDLFDLIDNAYKPIGGHVKFKQPSDVMDPELQFWRAADLDDDPDLDVVYLGKQTPFGVKRARMQSWAHQLLCLTQLCILARLILMVLFAVKSRLTGFVCWA